MRQKKKKQKKKERDTNTAKFAMETHKIHVRARKSHVVTHKNLLQNFSFFGPPPTSPLSSSDAKLPGFELTKRTYLSTGRSFFGTVFGIWPKIIKNSRWETSLSLRIFVPVIKFLKGFSFLPSLGLLSAFSMIRNRRRSWNFSESCEYRRLYAVRTLPSKVLLKSHARFSPACSFPPFFSTQKVTRKTSKTRLWQI